jgi:phosphatidylserine/phosphatidylglycerophosphate/cardiolipin synthase-like enzyme
MPTLAELKAKWFLPLTGDVLGVPQTRHTIGGTGPQLSVSTDGNTVVPLIDGKDYMRKWADMVALAAASGHEVYHTGWRFEAVQPLGYGTGRNAIEMLRDSAVAGASVYPMLSMHTGTTLTNEASVKVLRGFGVPYACRDNRFPSHGSNHQKKAVFKMGGTAGAVLGSIDISRTRWDDPTHAPVLVGRDPAGKPTHDTGIYVEGPAVADLDLSFRERWNDSTRTLGMRPLLPPLPRIATPVAAPAAGGTHSVQVLRTYGITTTAFGYSWAPRGEFTVWASYLNAIRNAARYIYLEDQYFLPWDYPPRFARSPGPGRDVDIVFQLAEAVRRGVKLVVLVPSNAEDPTHMYQKFQRDLAVNHLRDLATSLGRPNDVVIISLRNASEDVYVHSKLMMVDDELTLIGSANIGQRSMAHDGELHAAIVDAAGSFTREFRKALWAEHTGRAAASLDDPMVAIPLLRADALVRAGHLKWYDTDPRATWPLPAGMTPPTGHARALRSIIDPYAGPPGLA